MMQTGTAGKAGGRMPEGLPKHSKLLREAVGTFALVEVTAHALEQMQIRDITETDVLQALRRPDKDGLPTQPGRKHVRRNKTARVAIDVVYEELPDRIRVITTFKKPRRIIGS
jgi:hypothetical protein